MREPQLFDNNETEYLQHLLHMYGDAESGNLSTAAWAAHEADAEREVRERAGAEGVTNILERTKESLRLFERYANIFHHTNPNSHLIIWAGSHYDTISPLVKDATNTPLKEYVPVAYGGGVVIDLPRAGNEATLRARRGEVTLKLGRQATTELHRG